LAPLTRDWPCGGQRDSAQTHGALAGARPAARGGGEARLRRAEADGGQWRERGLWLLKVMTCWKVGRFVQRAVSGRKPKVIRSFVASSRHWVGSGPCAAASCRPAASSAAQSGAAGGGEEAVSSRST